MYFEGACYQEMKEFDKAIADFEQALAINPLHASAEFALARALQRTGQTAEAKEHFKRFQHLTSTKISSAHRAGLRRAGALLDGDAGGRSRNGSARDDSGEAGGGADASQVCARSGTGGASFTAGGGACMMDVTGSGQMDLVLMQTGAQAIRVLHQRAATDSFEELDAAAAGLKAEGHAVACAVGDYDGDGLNDLAVALDDAVLLYQNLGHGQFKNVTAESGLGSRNRPVGHHVCGLRPRRRSGFAVDGLTA